MHETIWKWRAGAAIEAAADELAIEQPLEIRVRGRSVCVTMRTPGHDDELAAGFMLTEGMLHSRGDVHRIEPCGRDAEGNIVNIFLSPDVAIDFDRLTRHVFASASCGLCGKASIESVHQHFPPLRSDLRVRGADVLQMPATLRAVQTAFERTGGLHAAGLFDEAGQLLVHREDVGRHNAVDKVLGHALLHDRLPLAHHVLLVSGRASFEIMQKALAARIAIVAAVSAPSSLAVEFARESGQTLIGFVRDQRMNVYAGVERVLF